MVLNVVPTDTLIMSSGIQMVSKCSCCTTVPQVESSDHLFLFGEVVVSVWNFFKSLMSMHAQSLTVTHTINTWWMEGSNKLLRGWLCYMLPPIILWNIWKASSKQRSNNLSMSVAFIIEQIREDICMIIKAAQKNGLSC